MRLYQETYMQHLLVYYKVIQYIKMSVNDFITMYIDVVGQLNGYITDVVSISNDSITINYTVISEMWSSM